MTRKKAILFSFLLSLPVLAFLLHHYFHHSPDLHPTGFTVDENVLYMSYAHQYLDSDKASLFYSNPFDGDPASAKIYFQPVNFLFTGTMKMGLDPGFVFSLFGYLMAIACIYMGIRIIEHLSGHQKGQSLAAVLFTWGGGLTAIAGLLASTFLQPGYYTGLDGIFAADPANGWWGLNWGRNLFIPLEAFYHFLFLLTIYLLLKKNWKAALVSAFFLSISHPFTGIEFLSVIMGWLVIEKLICRNKDIPYWFAGSIFAVTLFHCWYYLIYLNQFPEHRLLFSQYSAGWTYSLLVAIPAYCLVGSLALFTAWKNKPLSSFLSAPHQRLFLCWSLISFLLSKHEWFIKPMQPIHFTRGYTWAGLFLLSLPGLLWLIHYFRQRSSRKWILIAMIILLLSDNILWVSNLLRKKETSEWEGHITRDTKEVLHYLKKNGTSNDLLIGNATLVNYLANVYTPVNAWVSHPYNTPEIDKRREAASLYLTRNIKPADWSDRRILIIINKNAAYTMQHGLDRNMIYSNGTYMIFTP